MKGRLLFCGMALLLAACDTTDHSAYEPEFGPRPAESRPEYVFGIHPQRNPEKLHAVFGPVVAYLNAHLPEAHFIFEASRHYESFDEKIVERRFEFLLPNPYETVLAMDHGYRVIAKMGRDEDLRGLILTRRDSGVRDIEDLKGKAVSFPAPTALAATMLPMYFLYQRGLDPRRDIQARYVGSMESSLLNIVRGHVAAGTVYPPAWRMFRAERPALAEQLVVLWETDSLPNNSVMVRDDLPGSLVQSVRRVLVSMHQNVVGRQILEGMDLPYFEDASNATYAPVAAFVQRYEQVFGPLQQEGREGSEYVP